MRDRLRHRPALPRSSDLARLTNRPISERHHLLACQPSTPTPSPNALAKKRRALSPATGKPSHQHHYAPHFRAPRHQPPTARCHVRAGCAVVRAARSLCRQAPAVARLRSASVGRGRPRPRPPAPPPSPRSRRSSFPSRRLRRQGAKTNRWGSRSGVAARRKPRRGLYPPQPPPPRRPASFAPAASSPPPPQPRRRLLHPPSSPRPPARRRRRLAPSSVGAPPQRGETTRHRRRVAAALCRHARAAAQVRGRAQRRCPPPCHREERRDLFQKEWEDKLEAAACGVDGLRLSM